MTSSLKKSLITSAIITTIALGAWLVWTSLAPPSPPKGLIASNGRIQATDMDIATKFGGRIEQILVDEGDSVQAGQILAHMQIDALQAQLREAQAQWRQTRHAVDSAKSHVVMRHSEQAAAQATVAQRRSELNAAQRRLQRSERLAQEGASSHQERDDDRANALNAQSALHAAQAHATAARAAIEAAQADVIGAESAMAATQANIERIQADLSDSELKAPRDGRVQYRLAQAGEVLADGDKVLNLIDLSETYMSFFLPTEASGTIELGSEVRIMLDAAPDEPIPARISFVAEHAQFTPKHVETRNERQKLMFRVKAQIQPDWLRENTHRIKSGLPGVAWVKTDPQATWPESLRQQEQP
ncbi:HlyD family secretion protein [Alcaligenes sp. SDU_A2]|uniref:HlyD family secretion protein n=1 Tax=Alcaligenes sp. SDU_A2 TaxID=3136634 RepID=UPI00312037F0